MTPRDTWAFLTMKLQDYTLGKWNGKFYARPQFWLALVAAVIIGISALWHHFH